ncbi:hypothetical protein I553_6709 [Mycobacterium xenopi 4042]|uniref:Uncharacterized protein n=1 Tax=Mycobacterium xenopi 4042 TaxID=1299334 RepID=X8DC12_MYCXE|nr:hypothetical protein I552_6107 [Mycobacterium xenopi 3993]EUA66152.1 hypothetical protein I553_6709 [Mycobacterium xenopi 4042]
MQNGAMTVRVAVAGASGYAGVKSFGCCSATPPTPTVG